MVDEVDGSGRVVLLDELHAASATSATPTAIDSARIILIEGSTLPLPPKFPAPVVGDISPYT